MKGKHRRSNCRWTYRDSEVNFLLSTDEGGEHQKFKPLYVDLKFFFLMFLNHFCKDKHLKNRFKAVVNAVTQ